MEAKINSNKMAQSLEPKDAPYKCYTVQGFFLLVMPNGAKYWRYEYRFGGIQTTISLGTFKNVDYTQARKNYEHARNLLNQGINPSADRKRIKEEIKKKINEEKLTFKAVALEWHKKASANKATGYAEELMQRLENHIFGFIGNKKIIELETSDILAPLRAKEKLEKFEMAHRLASIIKNVFKYAKAAGYIKYNIASDISDTLTPAPRKRHRPCLKDPIKVGELLNKIEKYNGSISMKYALMIMPYVFLRSKELRGAKWEEFDFEKAQWLVPAERMKRRKEHLVPLSKQVIKLLKELKELSPEGEFLFPSKSKTGFISCEGFRETLKTLGYSKEEMCIHGFRGTLSTLLNEKRGKYRADVIEAQLAHAEKNSVREAYNHAQYLPERIELMQDWADYLDTLKQGQEIESIQ